MSAAIGSAIFAALTPSIRGPEPVVQGPLVQQENVQLENDAPVPPAIAELLEVLEEQREDRLDDLAELREILEENGIEVDEGDPPENDDPMANMPANLENMMRPYGNNPTMQKFFRTLYQ